MKLKTRACVSILVFIFGNIIAYIFYNKKYLRGKDFSKWDSAGWWVLVRSFYMQKIIGINRKVPWPTYFTAVIKDYKNIVFHVDDILNFQSPGVYWQSFKGKIYIGKGSFIAPNVGLITSNHNPYNLNEHLDGKDIVIGENCWIGMNSVILPGVILGSYTTVGAGSVVTKSFISGKCIIAGNPAKIIRTLL